MENHQVVNLLEAETSLLTGEGVSKEEISAFCKKHSLEKDQVVQCLIVHVLLVAL